jgi:hypothetical protein
VQRGEHSDELKRAEARNSELMKQNADLAAMMAENQRLLQELLLTNAALTAAMAAFTSSSQKEAYDDETTTENKDKPVSIQVEATQPLTPVKQRKSKKSSLEEIAVRTPPKPPEGTPRRSKKKKVSASPASNQDTSNRFSPLRNANSDDEESDTSGIQHESTIRAPVKTTGESVAQDDQQATATIPPLTQQNSPDFGSNGVGQPE